MGRQPERGFGALAKVFGRTAAAFLHNNIVPAAEQGCADLLEFAAPEIAQVVSARKKLKTATKSVVANY